MFPTRPPHGPTPQGTPPQVVGVRSTPIPPSALSSQAGYVRMYQQHADPRTWEEQQRPQQGMNDLKSQVRTVINVQPSNQLATQQGQQFAKANMWQHQQQPTHSAGHHSNQYANHGVWQQQPQQQANQLATQRFQQYAHPNILQQQAQMAIPAQPQHQIQMEPQQQIRGVQRQHPRVRRKACRRLRRQMPRTAKRMLWEILIRQREAPQVTAQRVQQLAKRIQTLEQQAQKTKQEIKQEIRQEIKEGIQDIHHRIQRTEKKIEHMEIDGPRLTEEVVLELLSQKVGGE